MKPSRGTGLISAAPGESAPAEFWDLIAFTDYFLLFPGSFSVFLLEQKQNIEADSFVRSK